MFETWCLFQLQTHFVLRSLFDEEIPSQHFCCCFSHSMQLFILVITDSATAQARRYSTLWNIRPNVIFSQSSVESFRGLVGFIVIVILKTCRQIMRNWKKHATNVGQYYLIKLLTSWITFVNPRLCAKRQNHVRLHTWEIDCRQGRI